MPSSHPSLGCPFSFFLSFSIFCRACRPPIPPLVCMFSHRPVIEKKICPMALACALVYEGLRCEPSHRRLPRHRLTFAPRLRRRPRATGYSAHPHAATLPRAPQRIPQLSRPHKSARNHSVSCSFSGRGVVPFTPSLRHERPKLKRRALDEPEGGTGAATAAAPRVESTTHSSNWRLIMKLAETALWGRQRRPPRGRQRRPPRGIMFSGSHPQGSSDRPVLDSVAE